MERKTLNLKDFVLFSLALHFIFLWWFFLPEKLLFDKYEKSANNFSQKKILVNINENKKSPDDNFIVLSEKDSHGEGFITKKKGHNWLNNSTNFQAAQNQQKNLSLPKKILAQDSLVKYYIERQSYKNIRKQQEKAFQKVASFKIPDFYNFTKENALFFSNEGNFSFNSKKFPNAKYFLEMKNKISKNWYPPLLANATYSGGYTKTGFYAPGAVRIKALANQQVDLFFVLNKNGDVVKIQVKNYENQSLRDSCVQAIKNSHNFGKVPLNLLKENEFLVIPFIFYFLCE